MGRADRDDMVPHFSSMEERDRWQIQQYGHVRNGFRTEHERQDERPLLYYALPFWADAEEERRYERAVRACPLSQYGHMRLPEYLAAVVEVAEGLEPRAAVKAMPEVVAEGEA